MKCAMCGIDIVSNAASLAMRWTEDGKTRTEGGLICDECRSMLLGWIHYEGKQKSKNARFLERRMALATAKTAIGGRPSMDATVNEEKPREPLPAIASENPVAKEKEKPKPTVKEKPKPKPKREKLILRAPWEDVPVERKKEIVARCVVGMKKERTAEKLGLDADIVADVYEKWVDTEIVDTVVGIKEVASTARALYKANWTVADVAGELPIRYTQVPYTFISKCNRPTLMEIARRLKEVCK